MSLRPSYHVQTLPQHLQCTWDSVVVVEEQQQQFKTVDHDNWKCYVQCALWIHKDLHSDVVHRFVQGVEGGEDFQGHKDLHNRPSAHHYVETCDGAEEEEDLGVGDDGDADLLLGRCVHVILSLASPAGCMAPQYVVTVCKWDCEGAEDDGGVLEAPHYPSQHPAVGEHLTLVDSVLHRCVFVDGCCQGGVLHTHHLHDGGCEDGVEQLVEVVVEELLAREHRYTSVLVAGEGQHHCFVQYEQHCLPNSVCYLRPVHLQLWVQFVEVRDRVVSCV
uniref:Uncharacterized protein n=1 Tax=Lygus hesperus TaxID=30085 RepID=A0A0A9YWH2_LYGHE